MDASSGDGFALGARDRRGTLDAFGAHCRGAATSAPKPVQTNENAASPLRITCAGGSGVFIFVTRKEEFLVLGRPGSDLLSQGLSRSTIGAEEFNGRVRDGIGFKLLARTTRPAKDKDTKQAVWSFISWLETLSRSSS